MQTRARPDLGSDPSVEILYFTDPYCSWCWAAEPVWLRLKETYGHIVHFRIIMGGLVEKAGDALQGDRAAWLAQHMRDVSARSGQAIDERFLEYLGPEFSTWPACIHVKAAQIQGPDIGEHFLRRLRRAALTEQANISESDTAEVFVDDVEGMSATSWKGALSDGTALSMFLEDRRLCQEHEVSGFPTFLIRTEEPDRPPARIVGARSFQEIEQTLREHAPWLRPRDPRPVIDQLFDLGPLTTREVQEIQGTTPRETMDVLDGLAAEGTIVGRSVGAARFWALAD